MVRFSFENFTVIQTHRYNISRGFLRGLRIFRLLPRPGITVFGDVRREFTHCGLKLGLEIPSRLQPAQQELQNRGTKIQITVKFNTLGSHFWYIFCKSYGEQRQNPGRECRNIH